jgi:hypothetical protein
MPLASNTKVPWYMDGTDTKFPMCFEGTNTRPSEFVSWKNAIERCVQRNPHPEMSSTHCASLFLIGKPRKWYESKYAENEPEDLAMFFDVIGSQFSPQVRNTRRSRQRRKRNRHMTSEHQESMSTFRVQRKGKSGEGRSTWNGKAVGPVLLNAEDNQWEVKGLINHRHKFGERQFRVWFSGCLKSDAEWIREVDVDEALVAQYCTSRNIKPARLNRKTKKVKSS